MRPNRFDRDRRVANVILLCAVLMLLGANFAYAFGVPYMPYRWLAVAVAAVAIFFVLLWVVVRHSPNVRMLVMLATACGMVALALLLQLEPSRQTVSRTTGISLAYVQPVLADSLTEGAFGLVLAVTVSLFVTASSASYTAQQRAEELETTRQALLESQGLFRRAFEDGPIGMAIVDAGFRFIRVNRAFCENLGYGEEELIGQGIDFVTHPDDLDASRAISQTIQQRDQPQSFEKRYRQKDGGYFWGKLTAAAVRDRDGKLLYSIGMVENVTERKRMEEATHRDRQFLRNLLDLQERERRFIAHEIHDGFVQQTVAAKMHLEAFQCSADTSPGGDPCQLDLAVGALDDAIKEGRRMIGELRPMIIDEGGIVAAIEYLVNDGLVKRALPVEFVHDVRFRRLDPLLEGTIFRITQEALTNVWRHSQSPRAQVRLEHTSDEIHLEIRDWGVGFDPALVDASRYGIRGLQERARLFGGQATLESHIGQGTCVRVQLPIIDAEESPPASPDDRP